MKTSKITLSARIILTLLLPILVAGCSSTGYMADRGRDAADIFTLTLGVGTGVKLRAGPVILAAEQNSDLIGLRSGKFFWDGNGLILNDEFYLPIPINPVFPIKDKYKINRNNSRRPAKTYQKQPERKLKDAISKEDIQKTKQKIQREKDLEKWGDWQKQPTKWSNMFGDEKFSHGVSSISNKRNKDVASRSPFPFIVKGKKAPFYTEIEGIVGIIFSIHAGVNVGEITDFILGWVGIDIYDDDL